MKTFKPILLIVLGVMLITTSCRTEDDLSIDPPTEETITANSTIANLMSRTVFNDGSNDNIIDNASCISIQFPVTVTVNGITLQIDNDDDLDEIEDIFDELDDDDDNIVISYPITIVFADFTTIEINSDDELQDFADDCFEDNFDDDDIECIDFQYPITASVYDENNDLINSIIINNDNDMYDFIDDLDEYAAVTINFPITVILADGTTQTINNIQELATAIEDADDTCDEDDDNDYDDDDCDNCSTDLVTDILTQCDNWYIDDLERNDNDLEDNYAGYFFTFNNDNTLQVSWDNGTQTESGTWSASGSGNTIIFEINVPGFDDINDSWNLHEIENYGDELEFKLRIGDEDELEFKNNCSSDSSNDNLVNTLSDGLWIVASYTEDNDDQTSNYSGYELDFNTDGTVSASNGSNTNSGTWTVFNSGNEMMLDFGTDMPFQEFNDDDWDVISSSETEVILQDVSGGNGGTDTLTLQKL
jgi:hypothetical protein